MATGTIDMKTRETGRAVWQNHWAGESLTRESVRKMVNRESRTCYWKATRDALVGKFGSLEGLKVIELGSGKGDVSLLLALEGADVMLLDREQQALQQAQQQFGYYGLKPQVVVGDIFDIHDGLKGAFDLAISWGVVEHFQRPVAFQACLSHRRAVHDQGMVVISVPNSWCVPYRLNKWCKHLTGTWKWGLELPFGPDELKIIGRRMGLKNVWVHGSSIVRDLDQFLFHPVMGRMEKYFGLKTELKTPLDPLLGHVLTMFGEA